MIVIIQNQAVDLMVICMALGCVIEGRTGEVIAAAGFELHILAIASCLQHSADVEHPLSILISRLAA